MGTVVAQSSVGEPILATGLQGTTDYTFRQLRQLTQALSPGVVGANDLKVSAGAGMSVNIATGAAFVEGKDDTADRYLYPVPALGSTVNLSGITAPTGATRRDMVVQRVYDNGEDSLGTTADAKLQYIRNATETTTAEATPDNSLLLAYVDVTVGAGSITAGMITDMRPGCGGPGAASVCAGISKGSPPVSTSTVDAQLTTNMSLGGVGLRVDTTNGRIYFNTPGLYLAKVSVLLVNGSGAARTGGLYADLVGAGTISTDVTSMSIYAPASTNVSGSQYALLRPAVGDYIRGTCLVSATASTSFSNGSLVVHRIGS